MTDAPVDAPIVVCCRCGEDAFTLTPCPATGGAHLTSDEVATLRRRERYRQRRALANVRAAAERHRHTDPNPDDRPETPT